MIYDLGHMAWASGMRADVELRFSGPTLVQEADLRAILSTVTRHWAQNIPQILPKGFRDADGEDQVERTHRQGMGVAAGAVAGLWSWVRGLDRWRKAQFVRVVKAATGLDTGGMAPLLAASPELSQSVEWAVSLIKDLNDDMRKRTISALIEANLRGASVTDTEKALRRVISIGRRRARLIARDQTHKIASKLNELQQRAAGIDQYVWQHSFKKNPRRHHVFRQGRVFRWAKPPRDGHPGHAINCRCDAVALLKVKTRREVYLNAYAG